MLTIAGCPTPEAANVIQPPEQDPLNANIVTANLSAFQFDGSDQIYFDCVVEICGNYPDICVVVSTLFFTIICYCLTIAVLSTITKCLFFREIVVQQPFSMTPGKTIIIITIMTTRTKSNMPKWRRVKNR